MEALMDEQFEADEYVDASLIEGLMDRGMEQEHAVLYGVLMTRLVRLEEEGRGIPVHGVPVIRSLVEQLVESLMDRVDDEHDAALEQWSEEVGRALAPSLN